MINKKAVAIAINTVVMMIIGLVIFILGMYLFAEISSSANSRLKDLEKQVESDIASLECTGDKWICIPSYSIKNGEEKVFKMFITNHGDVASDFSIELVLDDIDGGGGIDKSSTCGSIVINYLESFNVSVRSGYSASLPFIVKATRVSDSCSFTSVAILKKDGIEIESASVIVRVE